MSKKAAFPVMSTTIAGTLLIAGLFVIVLRILVVTMMNIQMAAMDPYGTEIVVATATLNMYKALLGYPALILIAWAGTIFAFHPAYDSRTRFVFFVATLFILIVTLTSDFKLVISLG
nr:hypothetical protein [Candidatus Njordarchaeota archaeon]